MGRVEDGLGLDFERGWTYYLGDGIQTWMDSGTLNFHNDTVTVNGGRNSTPRGM